MQTKELQQSKVIAVADLDLQSFEGFQRRYHKHLETSRTQEEAYEKTELDYKKVFDHEKYSGYNSFRVIRNRKLKTNK